MILNLCDIVRDKSDIFICFLFQLMGIIHLGVHGHLVLYPVGMVIKPGQGYAILHHLRMAEKHALSKGLDLPSSCKFADKLSVQVIALRKTFLCLQAIH